MSLLMVVTEVAGQEKFSDMIRLDYNINKSDDGVNIYETRIGGSKVFNLGRFRIGAAADLHKFDLDYTYTSQPATDMHFTGTYTLGTEFFVSYAIRDDWFFTAFVQPEIASDFRGDWTAEGFNFGYGGYFTRTWLHTGGATSSLTMGGEYTTAFGKLRFVPIVNYLRKINARWAYAIGYPYTYVSWKAGSNHTLKPILGLNAFYAGVQGWNGYFDDKEAVRYKLSYMSLSGRLNYEYDFNRGWQLTVGVGYTLYNTLDLYRDDTKDYTYDMASSPYISLGVNYKF